MAEIRTYQVSEVAQLSGLTVRTLHHWHAIGLLAPKLRSPAGYRLYTDDDLLRLQQILIRRDLGLDLTAIRQSLDDAAFDLPGALRDQLEALRARAGEIDRLIATLERTLATLADGTKELTMADIFDGFDPKQFDDEARERWGETDAWAQSQRRTKDYGRDDWAAVKDEQAAIFRALADEMSAGKAPGDAAVTAQARRFAAFIDRRFYPCDTAMLASLADMYEGDERFRATFEAVEPGLAGFVIAAFRAAAEKAAGA